MSDGFWSLVVVASLMGWIASTLILIFKAFPERGRFVGREAGIWGTALLISFAIWIVALLNA